MSGRAEGRESVITGLAIAAYLAVLVVQVAALWIWSSTSFATPAYVFMNGPIPLLALQAGLLAQATSALILMVRRPHNRVGWTIMAFALVVGAAPLAMTASASPQGAGPMSWLAWAGGSIVFPAGSFLAFLLAFIFPSGRLLSARWQPALGLVALAAVTAALAIALRPGPLLFFPGIDNPLLPGDASKDSRAQVALLLLASSSLVAGATLVARYRVSDEITRVQIRWYTAAGVVLALAYVVHVATLVTMSSHEPFGEAAETLLYLALCLPPVAITFAILRYRLYDIDTIIGRAFVYGALTALLAGIYTASIRLFNALFTAMTGETSDLALVITTLLLATSFTPIKQRLEQLAERTLGAPVPETAPATLLDDPAFSAALDARIEARVRSLRD